MSPESQEKEIGVGKEKIEEMLAKNFPNWGKDKFIDLRKPLQENEQKVVACSCSQRLVISILYMVPSTAASERLGRREVGEGRETATAQVQTQKS